MWVKQWPLTKEKLQALEQLVQEQLDILHIEELTGPWNSPVFVVKKKSGKWRILTDLRAVNKVVQPMGPLQSGIFCLPYLLKDRKFTLIDINIKNCFFTILLQEKEKFAFMVRNNSQPLRRYQWTILPQGMFNNPTLCQYFVS